MTSTIVPFTPAAAAPGNSGNSGNSAHPAAEADSAEAGADASVDRSRLALLRSPGSETDHFASDAAHDVAIGLLDTMQLEYGVTAKATEEAVKVLLLAAAFLRWDITISGRGELVSTMLLASLDETRNDLVGPQANARGAADRLAAAAKAGIRGDNQPPLIVPLGMAGMARAWLSELMPPRRAAEDSVLTTPAEATESAQRPNDRSEPLK